MTGYTQFIRASEYPDYSSLEEELTALFEELDAVVLDFLPASLSIPPVQLIARLIYERTGLLLDTADIIEAYVSYTNTPCPEENYE